MDANSSTEMLLNNMLKRTESKPVSLEQEVRAFFYLVTPNETAAPTLQTSAQYLNNAYPVFMLFILFEQFVLYAQGKPLARVNDSVSSISAGLVSEMPKIVARSILLITYTFVYDNFCIYSLPWDSPLTWWITMFCVDLGYYVVHRTAHEINLFWSGHNVHHSSEEYNLTTALRQGLLQSHFSWMFYLPLALFIPPSIFMIHQEFNLLFQFWIHTETIGKLGPIEWIFNTPSHHRVHHGRNPYCIDKNYAGVLIIWDRMFGTFEAEKDDEQLAYGLVHPLQNWNIFFVQLSHLQWVWNQFRSREGFINKIKTLFCGPGWEPGKPRLGLIEDLPEVKFPYERLNKCSTTWCSVYVLANLFITTIFQAIIINARSNGVPFSSLLVGLAIIIWSLLSFSSIFDRKWYAAYNELARCIFLAVFCMSMVSGLPPSSSITLYLQTVVSTYWMFAALWSLAALNVIDWKGPQEQLIIQPISDVNGNSKGKSE